MIKNEKLKLLFFFIVSSCFYSVLILILSFIIIFVKLLLKKKKKKPRNASCNFLQLAKKDLCGSLAANKAGVFEGLEG